MKKQILSLALALCLIMALVPMATAVPDLSSASTWARDGITEAIGRGFVPPDLQSNYTSVITRAEFCRMAVKWVEYAAGKSIDAVLSEQGKSRSPGVFTDTDDPDILAAFALGITSGTGNNQFSPDGQFTREQAATMIMNTCGAIGAYTKYPLRSWFWDLETASSWAMNGIHFARANGIMSGTGNDNFSPKALFTREQSIVTFNNIKPDELQVNKWADSWEYALYDEYLRDKIAEIERRDRGKVETWDDELGMPIDFVPELEIELMGKKVFDFDGDGIPELYYSIRINEHYNGQALGYGDWIEGGFCTIIDGKVVELLPLYSGENSGQGISVLYSKELSAHIIEYGTGGYECHKYTFFSMSNGELAMLGEFEAICDWENNTFTVNGIEVTEADYNRALEDFLKNYTEPIDDYYIFPSLWWY
jgi:hypothetical protein